MLALSKDGGAVINEIKLKELEVEEARNNDEPERDEESISNLVEEYNIQH
jgi:hypothetical protein